MVHKRAHTAMMHRVEPWALCIACVLAVLGVTGCGDDVAPTEPGRVEFDPTRLLDDAELRTPEDPNAPFEDAAWIQWIEANHEPVRSLGAEDFSDLAFFAPILANKRVVQLGESGHGVREFSQLKVRLIKYLHEELGYDVVAIESAVYECFMADRNVGVETARSVLDRCAFQVWRTAEVLELFEYIEETKATSRPLRLIGIDTQVSSTSGVAARPLFLHNVVNQFDTVYADSVLAIDLEFVERHRRVVVGQHVYLLGNRDWLIPAYDSLARFVEGRLPALAAMSLEAHREGLVAVQTARSTIAFIEQLTTESTVSTEHRDLGMSANLTFVTEQLYPGEKVVVWAHNFHIRHANHEVVPLPAPFTMGHWQKARLSDDLYTVGLYMYTGTTAANDRSVYPIAPAQTGSVESILYRARRHWMFVDLSGAEVSAGTSWMDGSVTANAWGVNPLSMTPRNQYDGILFVHSVSPPDYLN
jgi:erythromycin esterase